MANGRGGSTLSANNRGMTCTGNAMKRWWALLWKGGLGRVLACPTRLCGALRVPKAQCKWGRHCCRPHSHRRVDAPTLHWSPANLRPVLWSAHAWRPMSGPCASAPCGAPLRDSSPTLAPASGFRSCPAAFHCARRPRFPPPCAVAWPRPFPSPITRTTDWGLSPFPLHFCPARGLACPAPSRRARLKRASLPLAEACCMPSLDGHGD
jgi:hypothetical protein